MSKTPLMERKCKVEGQVRRQSTGRCYRPASATKRRASSSSSNPKLDRIASKVDDLERSLRETDKNVITLKESIKMLVNVLQQAHKVV